MLDLILKTVFYLAAAYFIFRWVLLKLSGEDLTSYDKPTEIFTSAKPSKTLDELNAYLRDAFGASKTKLRISNNSWQDKRDAFDAAGLARHFEDIEFRPDVINLNGREITGSWTLSPNSDPERRLLYMHGGAFLLGSDISHRPLTVQLARRTGMSVFTPNYRLMPEHTRVNTIEDAREAYKWIVGNGPNGKAPLSKLVIAGDSAGGNLALMLSNWARAHAARQADAVIAFSPMVDTTLSSPSIKANLKTDIMLSAMLGPLMKLPRSLLLLGLWKHYRLPPAHPDQSPIFDDLSNLPPTFIQACASELLHDDSARFAVKAQAADSPVFFQSWGGELPHVWQLFDNYIAESHAALDETQVFLEKYSI